MNTKSVTFAVLSALAIFANHAYAANQSGSPLQPAFFWATSGGEAVSSGSTQAHANANDPRHPTYARGANAQWEAVAADVKTLYLDLGNPLYPGYKR
jgi:hypothetical protein